MNKKYISLIAAALMITPAVGFAAEDAEITGSIELGVRGVDDKDNSAKFQEYRDLDDGLYSDILLDVFKGSYYFEIEGGNIGLDDQDYQLKGGQYDMFKYRFNYDETPHNLSFGARTFHSGVGTDNLSFAGDDPAPVENWSDFDYFIDRKKYGGEIEVSLGSPFFVNIGASRLEMDGRRPISSGSFSGTAEMPEPIDTTTDDLTLQAGYRSKKLLVSVTGMLSSFDNENLFLNWKNPFFGITDVNTLPPENDYSKLGANLTWKKLPYMSTFSVNGSYSKLDNDFTISDLNLAEPSGLNRTKFEGEVTYSNIAAALVSRPTKKLDTRLYYTYLDKDNDSDVIEHDFGSNAERLFDYSKDNLGLDVGYKLPFSTKAKIGYEYLDVDRTNRPDVDSTTDDIFYIQLKNTYLDFLSAKLDYKHVERDSDSDFDLTGLSNTDSEFIVQFVQRFDYTDKSKDEIKLTLEFYPLDNVDFGLEYRYIENDYDDVTLGRTDDEQNEFYADFMWRQAKLFTLSGFIGYETSEADSNHYNFATGSGTPSQTADPTVEDGNPDSFLWTQDIDDDFWTYGLTAKVPLMNNKLNVIVSWEYQDSDGESNFTTEGVDELLDLKEYDDYTRKLLEAKAVYAFAKRMDISLGYIYEKYKYEDLQFEGYEFEPPGSFLTGAYADHDYEANIGYLMVRYGF